MDIKLTEDEIAAVRAVLSQVVMQERSGQIGIMHGANRFVTMNVSLKKHGQGVLAAAYKKLGVNGPHLVR